MSVRMKDLFLETLKRDEVGTRKALERVPEGQNDWAPHEKSMKMGYLASLVASMPKWIDLMINQDELDFAPVGENKNKPIEWKKSSELVAIFDEIDAGLGGQVAQQIGECLAEVGRRQQVRHRLHVSFRQRRCAGLLYPGWHRGSRRRDDLDRCGGQ